MTTTTIFDWGQASPRFCLTYAVEGTTVKNGLGVCRLTIPCELQPYAEVNPDDTNRSNLSILLTGDVCLETDAMPSWLGTIHPVTRELPKLNHELPPRETSRPIDICLSLTHQQLHSIDRLCIGSISLRFKLCLTLINPPDSLAQDLTRKELTTTIKKQQQVTIPRGLWDNLCNQIGVKTTFTVGIPSPLLTEAGAEDTPDTPSLTKIIANLNKAKDQFRNHNWQETAATCRHVLEILQQLYKIPTNGTTKNPQNRTQEERWAALTQALFSLTSAANHTDDTTSMFVWERWDAESILITTAALVNKYQYESRYTTATATGCTL